MKNILIIAIFIFSFSFSSNVNAENWIVSKHGGMSQTFGAFSKSAAFCAANPDVALAFDEVVSTTPAQTTRIRENSPPLGLQATINVQAVCLQGNTQIRIRYGVKPGANAIEGQDFQPFSITVSTAVLSQFTAPVSASASGSLTLINDNVQENDETLSLGIIDGIVIVDPSLGGSIISLDPGNAASVQITIEDDDNLNPTRITGILGPLVALDPVAAAAVGPFAATCSAEAALPLAQQNATLIAQCQAILANPQSAIAALRAISGEEFSSQITSSQDSANFANQGVNGRLAALRGGATRQTIDDVAMNWNGKQIPMGALAAILGLAATDEGESEPAGGLLDRRFGAFFTGTARSGNRDENRFEVGFDYEGFQALGGVDYRFSNQFVGGVALGFSKMDTDLDLNAGYLDTQTVSGTAYGSFYPSDRLYVDFSLGFLKNDYDQGRVIDLTTLGGNFRRVIATGSSSGKQQSLSASTGYTFGANATTLTPNLRLSYAKTSIDGFVESGGGINDLIYPDQDFKSLQFSLGLNLSHTISLNSGVLQPYANFDLSREQQNEAFNFNPTLRIRPNQISTPIFIAESDRSFGRGELGLLFLMEGGWQISASYSQILGYRDLSARSISLTGRIEF